MARTHSENICATEWSSTALPVECIVFSFRALKYRDFSDCREVSFCWVWCYFWMLCIP
jgi:hypothetical protein